MRHSIMEKLFTLPDDTKVMPGHNYGRMPSSTIGHEKTHNPYLR
jgi:glyoxylase-like metal-dependent hydrolase (beta-lactamase superfamily II)